MLPFRLSGVYQVECEGEIYRVKAHHITINDKVVDGSQYHHTIEAEDARSAKYKFHSYYNQSDEVIRYTKTIISTEEKITVDSSLISIPESIVLECHRAVTDRKRLWKASYQEAKYHYHQQIDKITKLSADMSQNKELWLELTGQVVSYLTPRLEWYGDTHLEGVCRTITSCRQAIQIMPDSSSEEESDEERVLSVLTSKAGAKPEKAEVVKKSKKHTKDYVKQFCDQLLLMSQLFETTRCMLGDASTSDAGLQEAYCQFLSALEAGKVALINVRSSDLSQLAKKSFEGYVEDVKILRNRVITGLLAKNDFDEIAIFCDKTGKEATESVIQRAEECIKKLDYDGFTVLKKYFDLPLGQIFFNIGMPYVEMLFVRGHHMQETLLSKDMPSKLKSMFKEKLKEYKFFLKLSLGNKAMENTAVDFRCFEVLHHVMDSDEIELRKSVIKGICESVHAPEILIKIADATDRLPRKLEYREMAEDFRDMELSDRRQMLSEYHLKVKLLAIRDLISHTPGTAVGLLAGEAQQQDGLLRLRRKFGLK
ncbi:MAG: hypothetical protein VXW87_03515 [Pseudomonadota bacterium]|nr:hypothetical protein [Pseudomonadota bacterium]